MTDLTPDQIARIRMLLDAAEAGVPADEWVFGFCGVNPESLRESTDDYALKIRGVLFSGTFYRRRPPRPKLVNINGHECELGPQTEAEKYQGKSFWQSEMTHQLRALKILRFNPDANSDMNRFRLGLLFFPDFDPEAERKAKALGAALASFGEQT